jgi:hypothetical protein
LEGLMQLPPLDLEYGEETRLKLPWVYGGLSVCARAELQNRRSASQKSPDATLGDHLQVVRSAAMKQRLTVQWPLTKRRPQ